MKERPILFSGPMVRAILEGRKTQTRRIVKVNEMGQWVCHAVRACLDPAEKWQRDVMAVECPYGKPGDRLWVRETHLIRGAGTVVDYRADMDPMDAAGHGAFYGGWKRSLFMHREHSRISLEVTGVRVERLNDCSANDAMAEGVDTTEFWTPKEVEGRPFEEKWWDDFEFWNRYPQMAYRKLWESINGPGSWEANPWVWVVEFAPYTAPGRAPAREGEGRKSRSAEREELQAVDRPATSAGHAQTTKE